GPSPPAALTLHDALPIYFAHSGTYGSLKVRRLCSSRCKSLVLCSSPRREGVANSFPAGTFPVWEKSVPYRPKTAKARVRHHAERSEEHTSELQSRENLVC